MTNKDVNKGKNSPMKNDQERREQRPAKNAADQKSKSTKK